MKSFLKILFSVLLFTTLSTAAYVPYPVTSGVGKQRIEWVSVASICSSSPCTITAQSGAFTSVVRTSVGAYTANYPSGTFSVAPACVSTPLNLNGTRFSNTEGAPTLTSASIQVRSESSVPDDAFQIICYGTR